MDSTKLYPDLALLSPPTLTDLFLVLSICRGTVDSFGNSIQYRCSILLPPCVRSSARCVVGPKVMSKSLAKGAASLQCVKMLHECGELNDWLVTNGSKDSEKAERMEAVASSGGDAEAVCPSTPTAAAVPPPVTPTSAGPLGETGSSSKKNKKKKKKAVASAVVEVEAVASAEKPIDEETDLLPVIVKTVPDVMTRPADERLETEAHPDPTCEVSPAPPAAAASKRFKLFLYAVRAESVDETTLDTLTQCMGCGNSFFSLSQMGIALACELPADLFASAFDCNIRESEKLRVKIEFLECRDLSVQDLCQMQRFHK